MVAEIFSIKNEKVGTIVFPRVFTKEKLLGKKIVYYQSGFII